MKVQTNERSCRTEFLTFIRILQFGDPIYAFKSSYSERAAISITIRKIMLKFQ